VTAMQGLTRSSPLFVCAIPFDCSFRGLVMSKQKHRRQIGRL
jgi:hypothetical protein